MVLVRSLQLKKDVKQGLEKPVQIYWPTFSCFLYFLVLKQTELPQFAKYVFRSPKTVHKANTRKTKN